MKGCDERLAAKSHAGRSIVRKHSLRIMFGHRSESGRLSITDPPVQFSGSGSDFKHRSGIED